MVATIGIKVNITPSHLGRFVLTEVLEKLGLTVTKAAQVLGALWTLFSDLANRKAALSTAMAERIEKTFDVAMDMRLLIQV